MDEEESTDLERMRRERERQVKLLREREKKIAEQGRDLERAIFTLNSKLAEEDSPKLLRVSRESCSCQCHESNTSAVVNTLPCSPVPGSV